MFLRILKYELGGFGVIDEWCFYGYKFFVKFYNKICDYCVKRICIYFYNKCGGFFLEREYL